MLLTALVLLTNDVRAFALSVSGYAEQGELRRAYAAWLGFEIELDRFAGKAWERAPLMATLAQTSGFADPSEGGEASTEAMELEQLSEPDAPNRAEPDRSEDEPKREPAAADRATPSPEATESDASVAAWSIAPDLLSGLIAAVAERDALRVERVSGLASRARNSAWLPELKFRAGRNSDQTLRLTPTTDDPDRWALTGGAGLRLEGEVRWQFDRLVFASEEVPLQRLRLVLELQQARRVEQTLDWVFRWQHGVMRSLDVSLEPEARLEGLLRAEQARAALDVLSEGWFSAHVSGRRTPNAER
ncbi:MAG TPA: hypothetical protein VHM70_22545 [Polyangiaceae bacterium]|jgi:hypothetical protein|nr:hypothetical protein [Polyangiaceae bacterium]